ncbi:MAG: hypothetical protein ACYTG3_19500, partial [Planctomycetota bacterium]
MRVGDPLRRDLGVAVLVLGQQVAALDFALRRSRLRVPDPGLLEKSVGTLPLVVVLNGQLRAFELQQREPAVPELLLRVDVVGGLRRDPLVGEHEVAVALGVVDV